MLTPVPLMSTPKSSTVHVSMVFFFAIIIPLTLGLRISVTPLSKAKTQGAETATFSCPAELGRVAVNSPQSDETSDTRVTEEAPIISATPGPVEPALVSAACFPQKITEAPDFWIAAARRFCT